MPGKMTEIVGTAETPIADGEDFTAFAVPWNKLFEVTRIQITNRVNDDIRVRGWDTFIEIDGTVHSTSENPVPVFDYPVASQDAVVIDCADESKRVMGTLVLQAVSGAGDKIDTTHPVEVYVGGKFPF